MLGVSAKIPLSSFAIDRSHDLGSFKSGLPDLNLFKANSGKPRLARFQCILIDAPARPKWRGQEPLGSAFLLERAGGACLFLRIGMAMPAIAVPVAGDPVTAGTKVRLRTSPLPKISLGIRIRRLTAPDAADARALAAHQELEWVMLRPFDRDPAQLGKFVDDRLTTETAITARLDAAEGHLWFVGDRWTIDMANARLYSFCDRQRAINVAAENRAREAIFGIVGGADGFIIALHAHDRFDRPEGFLLIDLHRRCHVIEQCGLDDRTGPLATANKNRALPERIGNKLLHAPCRRFVNERSEHDVLTRVARGKFSGLGSEFGDKRVGNPCIDDEALGRHADLPLDS